VQKSVGRKTALRTGLELFIRRLFHRDWQTYGLNMLPSGRLRPMSAGFAADAARSRRPTSQRAHGSQSMVICARTVERPPIA
jgi:hypothetical protein